MDELREKEIREDERARMRLKAWEFVKVLGPPVIVVLGAHLLEKFFEPIRNTEFLAKQKNGRLRFSLR